MTEEEEKKHLETLKRARRWMRLQWEMNVMALAEKCLEDVEKKT